MKRKEIDECLKLYRDSLDAFAGLEGKLRASRAAADGLPLLRRTVRRLEEANGDLERIGDGLSILPELAQHLLDEKRISAMLRRQAAEKGIVLRYDWDEVDDAGEPKGNESMG